MNIHSSSSAPNWPRDGFVPRAHDLTPGSAPAPRLATVAPAPGLVEHIIFEIAKACLGIVLTTDSGPRLVILITFCYSSSENSVVNFFLNWPCKFKLNYNIYQI